MILINTGNGKGKTTAALGVAMRELGNGKRVAMVQFIKGPWKSGEDFFAKRFNIPQTTFKLVKTGRGFVGILGDTLPREEHRKAAQDGLALAAKLIGSKKYDLVILDEIHNAIQLKLLSIRDVHKVIKEAPKEINIIMTGRDAVKHFVALADVVTDMGEVKHIYNEGVKAEKGMDF
ncbi:MAG: Cob(I)alamin adenosyltransferase [Candidatus Wolfebacteria bacterium GW2011_GWE1_48_7]|uniref:Cob(I)alamin adenosyltransferase n=2 Tax=Candidatus Wolfeibacteriota TaxID=1752735 RepID=A0A0G1U8D4_9BACT|nr:MAG: cob(I)alamin adenosyltransferase [Candidatus Wolfebacteria bacterium GW2011_GWB1_47_1]KKU65737.1 MAG: Cob(I)alamin adenosyltransferase [Candidatus Wolfebacteria bacterium GW2011_GWD2_47_17]KKU90372.1 MAG: Cob(I)alamin adenosyltransferase [Candidatus Wolfebacteria bacterium GW2011_GWA2_47_9b]KKW00432.1 MAG: Cob(I)alamin adenosyltransferase [Candidatus Wolfebacteria bacterium GW2011_GWE1_48_7]